ncbi:phosphonopyruvate decarboxylase [Bacillus horti]|uniref:Phosphonopyruvate decarboxylase n=1 Tax=Caldalkalibacillus horti TaxID=77523 RepID=A0ABT9VZJ9_9BACI|nr:phosphonopyruvate decarboxylase [Bacillus horti]MDQ0166407.1 phosphonopyruvate decarboxylase [Bacillus horti]
MISTELFGEQLKSLGYQFFTGVPCSSLKYLINYAINDCEYIAAANEGDAVAIAAGAYTGGQKSVVLMQNSGLANAISPLVSLNHPFRIPVLGFVSLRGEPGVPDEPQHELMGEITTTQLELMQIKWQYLSKDLNRALQQLKEANSWIEKNESFFFVVKKGTFDQVILKKQEIDISLNQVRALKQQEDQRPSRHEALTVINSLKDKDTIQLATTGMTGRELYEIEDSPSNLYMVGSMGCVSSFGLGVSLAQRSTNRNVVVIDGDGSLIMRMGSLATNGTYHPPNMLHVLLDNNAHDSTGGQSTVSHNVQFVEAAASCGYAKSFYVHNLTELKNRIEEWRQSKGLTFLHLKTAKGHKEKLGRPKIKPYEVRQRLQLYLKE